MCLQCFQVWFRSLFFIFFLSDVFDPNIPEEGPSAPPPGWLDDIHGYQGHKGGGQSSALVCNLIHRFFSFLSVLIPRFCVCVCVQRMITRCTRLPLPTTPSLNSTGTRWCPMSGNTHINNWRKRPKTSLKIKRAHWWVCFFARPGSPQCRRTWPEMLCSSLWNQNGDTAPNLPGTSPSKSWNPSLCTGYEHLLMDVSDAGSI